MDNINSFSAFSGQIIKIKIKTFHHTSAFCENDLLLILCHKRIKFYNISKGRVGISNFHLKRNPNSYEIIKK